MKLHVVIGQVAIVALLVVSLVAPAMVLWVIAAIDLALGRRNRLIAAAIANRRRPD